MSKPYQVVKDFEQALCEYTGSPYAVTVTSCTMALLLACRWRMFEFGHNININIPKHTYVSVPQVIRKAGFNVSFHNQVWRAAYELFPLGVWDSARWFTKGLFNIISENIDSQFSYVCCSFHWAKTLGIGQGGCILHNNDEADDWFRRMRFDGRKEGIAPKDDEFYMLAEHCYMSPRDAAEGLSRLAILPDKNEPLPNSDYPDLSRFDWNEYE